MNKKILILILICFVEINAQDKIISIWPSLAPGTENIKDEEFLKDERIYKVYQPDLRIFLSKNQDKNRPGILIMPGGGYSHITLEKEGYKVAEWLNKIGINAFVLKYRLNPSEALQDAERALDLIRKRSGEFNLNPDKIGVLGFSAGGHLAVNLAENISEKLNLINDTIKSNTSKPDFLILLYPALDELVLNDKLKTLPDTFIVHAADDKRVPVELSIRIFNELQKNYKPVELHIFKSGGHGFGMGLNGDEVTQWPELCKTWMISEGFLTR